MTAERALAYLRALNIGLRDAAVRAADSDPAEAPSGAIVRARGERFQVVLALAPGALAGLAAHDAERALQLLERPPDAS